MLVGEGKQHPLGWWVALLPHLSSLPVHLCSWPLQLSQMPRGLCRGSTSLFWKLLGTQSLQTGLSSKFIFSATGLCVLPPSPHLFPILKTTATRAVRSPYMANNSNQNMTTRAILFSPTISHTSAFQGSPCLLFLWPCWLQPFSMFSHALGPWARRLPVHALPQQSWSAMCLTQQGHMLLSWIILFLSSGARSPKMLHLQGGGGCIPVPPITLKTGTLFLFYPLRLQQPMLMTLPHFSQPPR